MALAPLAKQSINSPVSICSAAPFKLSALVPLKEKHQDPRVSPNRSEPDGGQTPSDSLARPDYGSKKPRSVATFRYGIIKT